MGIVVGVAGTLCYVGRMLVVRWHGTKAPIAAV
jgi:DHA1 family bicyclomycin/chloramphenicol resistance-like MFS transporter